jgi:hypothetical protein
MQEVAKKKTPRFHLLRSQIKHSMVQYQANRDAAFKKLREMEIAGQKAESARKAESKKTEDPA